MDEARTISYANIDDFCQVSYNLKFLVQIKMQRKLKI